MPNTEKDADKNRAPNRSGSRVEARGRARLLVDPDFRRRGVARALMQTARSAAVADQRVPVLEVVDSPPAAIAVYRDSGWVQIGRLSVPLQDGGVLHGLVFTSDE